MTCVQAHGRSSVSVLKFCKDPEVASVTKMRFYEVLIAFRIVHINPYYNYYNKSILTDSGFQPGVQL